MASIGRIVSSAFSAIAEVSPALAQVNFDFTLLNVEAPAEFKEVGKALSGKRRAEAESGRSHVTARQLGALFSSILPKTPQLFSAYGRRASDILQSTNVNPVGEAADGFFSDFVGADATTIWAGATSGSPAIAAHLLSCFLARIWDPPEAISIWVEIVESRKKQIRAEFEGNDQAFLSDMCAAHQDISRQALAEWDASARAWLRCADGAMRRQQSQIRLIFQDLSTTIKPCDSTYDSVIHAWTRCLCIFESLASGTSLRVDSGDVALALSAWHLFPDILLIIDTEPVKVTQNDILFSGSVLTLGLQAADENSNGITWSLPLAYLRHYGEPVYSKHNVNSMERLTIEELRFVLLGAFTSDPEFEDLKFDKIIAWLDRVHNALVQEGKKGSIEAATVLKACSRDSWLGALFHASHSFSDAAGLELQEACRMVKLGRRQRKSFLGQGSHYLLSDLDYNHLLSGETDEERISFFRKAAAQLPGDPRHYFIRYRHQIRNSFNSVYEYATAKAQKLPDFERDSSHGTHVDSKHARWLYSGTGEIEWPLDDRFLQKVKKLYGNDADGDSARLPIDFTTWRDYRNSLVGNKKAAIVDTKARAADISSKGEIVFRLEDYNIEDYDPLRMGIFWASATQADPWYECVLGNEEAGLFYSSSPVMHSAESTRDDDSLSPPFQHVKQTASQISTAILLETSGDRALSDPILTRVVFNWLSLARIPNPNNPYGSLKAMSTFFSLLQNTRQATVNVRILEQGNLNNLPFFRDKKLSSRKVRSPISSSAGPRMTSPNALSLLPHVLSVEGAFSCLCFFETGRFDLIPSELGRSQVLAMCCGDSIYIANRLLTDPSLWDRENFQPPVKRIIGNIGRPGVAFLISPEKPMIRRPLITDFREIWYREYDGHLQDCFKSTSLHLSFTTAERVIGTRSFGARDEEFYFLETCLSVFEGRDWVADLDVVAAKVKLQECTHPNDVEDDEGTCAFFARHFITCLDNWTEVRNKPETDLNVVRAKANWQARMAAAALCGALGYHVTILPEIGCRSCIIDHPLPKKGVKTVIIA